MGFPGGSDSKEFAYNEGELGLVPGSGTSGMATHSSILAWRILWTEEPGELQSMGSQKVKHDGATNTRILQRRKKYNFGFHVERRVERRKHERRELSWSKEEPHCPDTAFAPGRVS